MTAAVPASPGTAAKASTASHAGAPKGATPAAPATGDAFAALMDALAALDMPASGVPAAAATDAATTAEDATATDAGPAPVTAASAAAMPPPLPSELPAAMLAFANAPVQGQGARQAVATDAASST